MARGVPAFVFAAALAFPASVLADAIDGDWCNMDGGHLRIDGAQIELGAGVLVQGKYMRHAYSYLAPAGDPEAGTEIYFVLRSDDEMRRVRAKNAMPEHADLWRRCAATS